MGRSAHGRKHKEGKGRQASRKALKRGCSNGASPRPYPHTHPQRAGTSAQKKMARVRQFPSWFHLLASPGPPYHCFAPVTSACTALPQIDWFSLTWCTNPPTPGPAPRRPNTVQPDSFRVSIPSSCPQGCPGCLCHQRWTSALISANLTLAMKPCLCYIPTFRLACPGPRRGRGAPIRFRKGGSVSS